LTFAKELKILTIFIYRIFCLVVSFSEAYDPLDPNGNITIKWDIMSWTPDGYVVSFSLYIYVLLIVIKA
jgi:hypothetical protein